MSNSKQLLEKINTQLICSQLLVSIVPYTNIKDFQENRDALLAASDFVKQFDKTKIRQAKKVSKLLQKQIDEGKQLGIIKRSEIDIAEKFSKYVHDHPECYRFGIEFGWLDELLDCSRLGFPKDLPYHARIGMGNHAGTLNVEERFFTARFIFFVVKNKRDLWRVGRIL